jgi:hypothetical protein
MARRLAAVAMVLLGAWWALSTINHIMMRASYATRREIRDELISLVLPGLLIFGGTTLGLGKRELIPPVSLSHDSRPADYWQDADDEGPSPRDAGSLSGGAP